MPRGIPGSGPNGKPAVQTLTILSEGQKMTLLNAVKSIQDVLGTAPVAQHAFTAPVRRRRRRKTNQNEQPTIGS